MRARDEATLHTRAIFTRRMVSELGLNFPVDE
jgi:hypothetical protein